MNDSRQQIMTELFSRIFEYSMELTGGDISNSLRASGQAIEALSLPLMAYQERPLPDVEQLWAGVKPGILMGHRLRSVPLYESDFTGIIEAFVARGIAGLKHG